MNTLKKILIGSVAIVAIVLFVGNFESRMSSNVSLGDSGMPNTLKKANVSTGPTVTTTSSDVLDASSGRVYAIFVNDGSVPIYLSLTGTTAAVASQGIRLNASGGSYEINLSNDYIGQVNAITASSTAVLTVTAFQ